MHNIKSILVLLLLFLGANAWSQNKAAGSTGQNFDQVMLTGKIETLHKEPIEGVTVTVFVNGKEQPLMIREADANLGTPPVFAADNEIESSSTGQFTAVLQLPHNTAKSADIKIHIEN